MDWYVHARLSVGLDYSVVDDLVDALLPHSGSAGIGDDELGLSFAVVAEDVTGAFPAAMAVLEELTSFTGGADVTRLEFKTEAEMDRDLAAPVPQ